MIIGASSGSSGFFLIVIVAFVLLYLIVVRPQRKRQSAQQRMLADLRVGDEVLTAGGIYGRVARLDENEVDVEIAPKVEVRVARRAIATIVTERDEPAAQADEQHDEHDDADDDGEKWRSAFDDDQGSGEEKPG